MIGKLEMFIALVKEQHFGRAATSLGITQPTLSTGIRQLEDHLGVKLVLRGSRYGGLTPEGQRALVWARQIVGDARRLREEMRYTREGLSGHLRIAVIPTALTAASHLAAAFNAEHPNVGFTIRSTTSVDLLKMLENLDIDAGISYLDNEPLGRVSSAMLYRETYSLVCAETHRLATREAVDWADLADEALSLLTTDMQNRRIINAAFMEAGVTPTVKLESNSTVVLVSQVLHGGTVTVLPEDIALFLTSGKGLKVIPIRRQGKGHAVGLVAPHQAPHTPVLQALLDMAAKLAARKSGQRRLTAARSARPGR
ncbi:LysR family transcriptional regulator [Antarcticimicrobium luteum]|uniref:LysR family transcriptional regulator n=1 Tax=Antarcticimicrobium luteum TaxID=2547397 RepID=A0A4R5UQM2_9RHOB|nr:LysR family transcriptional regulator [Antarcticimicrobium luteum]TDK41348.1 LysR family transcriptional regulator [Antarcticimicrobium luteum]